MPMPLWWGHVNKKVFNPRALKSGKWKILTHTGRISGRVYRTPLDATEVDGSYLFILVYGSRADWVRNVLASGNATLEEGREVIELTAPRLVSADVARPLLEGALPPDWLKIDEFLQMDISPPGSTT
ncbi:MAG TPA: nitroreductase family deazaflavin-dependent oxidoreductase [Acidimicrobiia bacterium]|nr:nitroreductase family deazaflavin-dependent oxidoreductase [Acidimicrobiia bacterium]